MFFLISMMLDVEFVCIFEKTSKQSFSELEFKEAVFADVELQGGGNLLVGLVYRSPNASEQINDKLRLLFQEIGQSSFQVLIFGDFNYPETDWKKNLV